MSRPPESRTELGGRIATAYPRIGRPTALMWAQSMLNRCEDLETCSEAVQTAAETFDDLSLAKLHRALDQVRRPKPSNAPQLAARSMPSEAEAKANAARARAMVQQLTKARLTRGGAR